jgi:excisionase family DNA binding protein
MTGRSTRIIREYQSYLRLAEAAEILCIHPGTLRRWIHRGKGPPFLRLAGQWSKRQYRFVHSEVIDWVNAQQQPEVHGKRE